MTFYNKLEIFDGQFCGDIFTKLSSLLKIEQEHVDFLPGILIVSTHLLDPILRHLQRRGVFLIKLLEDSGELPGADPGLVLTVGPGAGDLPAAPDGGGGVGMAAIK